MIFYDDDSILYYTMGKSRAMESSFIKNYETENNESMNNMGIFCKLEQWLISLILILNSKFSV